MKICVVGGGFTGILSAVTIKKHCPQHEVVMIDSDREPRNLGFGESGPPQLLVDMFKALKISPEAREKWVQDWLINTNSTLKYNFKWKNFTQREDQGWFAGMVEAPDYRIILDPSYTKTATPQRILNPDNNAYKLYDIWYELYMQGRRNLADAQPDLNAYYYYCRDHKMITHDGNLLNGGITIHINSFECCEWLKQEYAHELDQVIVNTIKHIQRDDRGNIKNVKFIDDQELAADFYLDCTGFKRLFAKGFGLKFNHMPNKVLHNAVTIVGNGYTKNIKQEMEPYTTGYGMDYGWCFSIPLLNRRSFGYVYNTDWRNADQALEELDTLSNPKTRNFEPLTLRWEPGYYEESFDKNYALVGLASGFVDAFDANTIALQFGQIFKLVEFFNNIGLIDRMKDCKERYRYFTQRLQQHVANRVEQHHCLAPRDTSEYWKHNHNIAKTENLLDRAFDELASYEHSPASFVQGDFVPFKAHMYLTHTLYFGADMSRRCKTSSPEVLELADRHFRYYNETNQLRASIAPNIADWYKEHQIDFDNFINFR